MGRYAFFNTGFEYKFAFAAQASTDIQLFDGVGEYGFHTWTQDDKTFIINLLYKLNIDFEAYEKNVDGTYALEKDLDIDYTIKLGCLIYHQLLYTDELTCIYDT